MSFQLDTINILILFVILINSIYGLTVYSRNRNDKINFSFFILTITISSWCLAMLGYRGFTDKNTVLLMARLLYFAAITIPTAFIYFVFVFPNSEVSIKPYQKYLVPIPAILLSALALYGGNFAFIQGVILRPDQETFIIFNTTIHILFGCYVISYFGWAYLILLKKYFRSQNTLKAQLKYIIIGTLGATITTLITNLFLLYFGDFDLNWLGQISILFMITLIFYSILKFRLFNIRVIATEIFVFILWMAILAQFFLSGSFQEQITNILLLSLLIGLGIFLVRSVIREISKSYDLERKARRELEKLNETKDQFIMITQHHLRTPVTSIRWGIEEALKGTYGELQSPLKKAMEDTNAAVGRLTRIVDDFLSITALKVGSQILTISPASILPMLEDIFHELQYDIKDKQLSISYPKNTADWPELPIDAPKIRETILIIIENAVRYNNKGGTIEISTEMYDGTFRLIVKNTGIGITPEEHEKLFTSLFYRGDSAKSAHPIGMGVGLSVSRAIIRAHHGELTIESEGRNKGAKAIITLPIKR